MKCFFLLLMTIVGFSGELIQGTLSNGIRYYIASDLPDDFDEADERFLYLVVKKPATWEYVTNDDSSYINADDDSDLFLKFTEDYSSVTVRCTGDQSLDFIENCLVNKTFPDWFIEEMCDDIEEQDVDREDAYKTMNHIFGSHLEGYNELREQENDQIREAMKDLLQPSRAALIITGPSPQISVEELEERFGKVEETIKIDPLTFQLTSPSVLRADEDDEYIDSYYKYYYPFEPSIRNFIINDLFILMGTGIGFARIPLDEWMPFGFFGAYWPIACPNFYENHVLFQIAKKSLNQLYSEIESVADLCIKHFLSRVAGPLQLDPQFRLDELEKITAEDLKFFVETNAQGLFDLMPLEL
ncbi:MAG: hypothetical protein K1X28_07530 [Parachlamydiales bacterium]|nr:hypothetical protein [Parachlamydiales bacterium]